MKETPSKYVDIRFYGGLNDFISIDKRHLPIRKVYLGSPTVKDLIESVGVPHVEIFLIVVEGNIVTLEFKPQPFSRISCYPRFYSIDIKSCSLIPREPIPPKFVLDVHLGKLASYLRLHGFDSLYCNSYSDDEILNIALSDNRIILTRDKGILRNGTAIFGYFVRNTNPRSQLKEVIAYFDISEYIDPFSRCSLCNGLIEAISREEVEGVVEDNTYRYYSSFYRCSRCNQIYWEGMQFVRIDRMINGSE